MSRMTYDQLQQLLRRNSAITVEGLVKSIPASTIEIAEANKKLEKFVHIPKDKIDKIRQELFPGFSITITGQIRGGKNNMIVTKKGKHIPRPEWKKWRDAAVAEVKSQLPKNWEPIDKPTNIIIEYTAGDHRRRDFPAICDSIFHVLERAGVVQDDTYLWPIRSSRDYNKHQPGTRITFL